MFKKNLWIVALLMVLSFTAFMTTSCVDALFVEEDTNTYSYVDLGTSFNTWGGQAYQSGWSTDNASWNDPNHTVKNLGLKIDDFKAARYLEIEIEGDSLAGGLDIIWGNESNGWNQTNGVAAGGAKGPLKIDLTKLKGYGSYKTSTEQIRIILQYNQPGQVKGLVKSAQLAIPDNVEFVPVTNIALSSNVGFEFAPYSFISEVTPSDATNQIVRWSIVSWLPKDGDPTDDLLEIKGKPDGTTQEKADYATSKAALTAKVSFSDTVRTIPAEGWWDYSVIPYEWNQTKAAEYINMKSLDKLNAFTEQGTLKVRATVENGKLDAEGKEINYIQDYTITVGPKLPIKYKLDGVEKQTTEYEGRANSGESTSMIVTSEDGSYTVTYSGGYGNCYAYFEVDFGSETYADYGGIKFKYKGVADDYNFKDVRLYGNSTPPPDEAYAPPVQIGTTKAGTGDASVTARDMDAPFTSQAFNAANKVYLWIVPWGGPMSFTISDIEIYKAAPCDCGSAAGPHVCQHGCGTAAAEWCDCECAICNPPNVAGTYTVPTAGAGEYYLDLNGDVSGYFNTTATPGLTRKIESGKVTYYINKADQGAYIPLCAIPPKI